MSIYLYERLDFLEIPGFAEKLYKLVDEDAYAELQNILQMNPEIGDLIQNTGGARKVRMALPGKGKSGGARVIYYLKMKKAIYFLDIYPKSKKNDLTHAERNLVAEIVADLKNEFRKKTL